jgi:GNAT superfamily N-acetyltransferase
LGLPDQRQCGQSVATAGPQSSARPATHTEWPPPGHRGVRQRGKLAIAAFRAEDKIDSSVWAVTCLLTRVGFRKRGVSRALARTAVEFARERGARAIEGYPMTTKNAILEELHVGTEGVFADAGFTEVSRPTLRRVVMRIDF